MVTKRLLAVSFFWPVNIFIDRCSSGYEELFWGFLQGRNVGKHCSKRWSGVLVTLGMVLLAGFIHHKVVNKFWFWCVPPLLAVL